MCPFAPVPVPSVLIAMESTKGTALAIQSGLSSKALKRPVPGLARETLHWFVLFSSCQSGGVLIPIRSDCAIK